MAAQLAGVGAQLAACLEQLPVAAKASDSSSGGGGRSPPAGQPLPAAVTELCHVLATAAGELTFEEAAMLVRQAARLAGRDDAAAEKLAAGVWCEKRNCLKGACRMLSRL